MFTPQKKGPWTPIHPSPAPRTEAKAGRLRSAAKGKTVAYVDGSSAPPPPPLSFLEGYGGGIGNDSGNLEDWRRFKEVGLLDDAALERRDHEALVETVARLEKELHDYQYNMGLILMEKNDLATNSEDLRHEVMEAREIFKREQSAHLIAMSEAEKREENLKRTLELEKSCVADLERAVCEMSDALEQAKATSKTDNTSARIAILHDERVEVESKLHSANIRVAEADRKVKELDMKLQELQTRESTLTAQRHTLDTERGTYESNYRKQKEEFKKWEIQLQEREERLHEQRRTLEEREDKIHGSERKLKQKENDIDQLLKMTDGDSCNLKQMEEDVSKRLNELAKKEKEAELLRINLERREQQLHALEERLSDKERVEIQKLIDEHRAVLETKSEELELEMQQKRNSLDEEFKMKLRAIEKKEAEVNHQEAKLAKMEQAVKEKSERFKEKEKKIEERSKAMKKEESCLKKLEKKIDVDRKDLSADRENMQLLVSEVDKLKDELRKKELLIQEENKKLKSNMEARSEHTRLVSSLNQEMEKWRHENELLVKEKEDLCQEKRRVEKDWEALDDKRATVESELKKLNEEKEKFERFKYLEEEKLNKDKTEMDGRIEQELESIRLEKESFAAKMKHEQMTLAETARNEHDQIVQEFEQRRRELENRVQKKLEEMEIELQEKKLSFEDKRSAEMKNINKMKELAEKKKEEMESGWLKVKRAREAIASDKLKLEEDQREIQKDINSLGMLSNKLKDQREQFLHERARFLSYIEKLNVCQTCGDFTSQFVISEPQLPSAALPQSVDRIAAKSSPASGDYDLSESDGQKSWLKKCASKIFKISSIKRMQDETDQFQVETPTSASPPPFDEDESKLQLQSSVSRQDPSASTSNAFDAQEIMQLNANKAPAEDPSFVDAPTDSKEPAAPEDSEQSSMQGGQRKPRRKASTGGRKRSSKTGVAGAEHNQRETSTLQEVEDEDEEPSYSNLAANAEADKATGTSARKRTRAASSSRRKGSQYDEDYSDGPADSITVVGRKKRREIEAVALPSPGEKRYNLRRNKTAAATTAAEASSPKGKDDNAARNHGKSSKKSVLNAEQDSGFEQNANSEHQGTVSTPKSIELSSEKAVRFKMPVGDDEVTKPAENMLSQEPNSIDNRSVNEEAPDAQENVVEDENANIFDEDGDGSDDDDDDDEDDGDDPDDVSMGRLLWKFFTT